LRDVWRVVLARRKGALNVHFVMAVVVMMSFASGMAIFLVPKLGRRLTGGDGFEVASGR